MSILAIQAQLTSPSPTFTASPSSTLAPLSWPLHYFQQSFGYSVLLVHPNLPSSDFIVQIDIPEPPSPLSYLSSPSSATSYRTPPTAKPLSYTLPFPYTPSLNLKLCAHPILLPSMPFWRHGGHCSHLQYGTNKNLHLNTLFPLCTQHYPRPYALAFECL